MRIFTTRVKTNLNGVLQMTQMVDGIMMTGDNAANQIIVELYSDFDKVQIAQGTKIVGYFIRSDGYSIETDGSVNESGEAVVIIPEVAYQVSGSLSIAVRMFDDEHTDTYRGYYKIIIKHGYYDSTSETSTFVEVDSDVTEGPHGEEVKDYVFSTNEFIQVTDDSITEGPNGEPVVTKTFNNWGTKIVIATLSCFVRVTESDSLIDVYHHIPDVQELLSYIETLDIRREEIEQAETARAIAENTRVSNENTRQSSETTRASDERTRVSNENIRKANETARISAESSRATAESGRVTAEASRVAAQNARNAKIDNMEVAINKLATYADPIVSITETGSDNHKKITFGIAPGDPFVIQKTFKTVSAMNSYTGTDLRAGQFVLITSDNGAEDVDNAKMYVVNTAKPVSSSNTFTFVTDLSGAQGIKGNGIASASLNTSDYKLTLNWTEGGSYTTPISIRGATGATGNGISSASFDTSTYKLTLNYTNGTSYTTPVSIRGATGATGNGISSASLDSSTYKLTLNWTDGTSYTTPISIRGATGATGNGISSAEVTSDNKLKFTYTNGTSYTTPISIKGDKGDPGYGGAEFTYDSTDKKLAIAFGSA